MKNPNDEWNPALAETMRKKSTEERTELACGMLEDAVERGAAYLGDGPLRAACWHVMLVSGITHLGPQGLADFLAERVEELRKENAKPENKPN